LNSWQNYDRITRNKLTFKRNEEESKFISLFKRASVAEKKQRGVDRTWPRNGAPTTYMSLGCNGFACYSEIVSSRFGRTK